MKNMFDCTYCGKEFKYESEKRRHELSHSPQFQCNVCSKKFSFISALRRHQKQHERTGSVQCGKCSGTFRDETLLKRHMKYAHKGTFTCSKCNATFNSELALRTHSKIHKPESERKYKCGHDGCKKTFNFAHHLKHHELTHTNSKQYFCSHCRKGFIQRHHLKTHLKTHDPEELYMCTVDGCRKKFAIEYAFKRHLNTHRTENVNNERSSEHIEAGDDCTLKIEIEIEDYIYCPTCAQLIAQSKYLKHTSKCSLHKGDIPKDLSINSADNIKNKHNSKNSEKSPVAILIKTDEVPKKIANDTISNCKFALGGCKMSGYSETSDSGPCAKISNTIENELIDIDIPNESVDPMKFNNEEKSYKKVQSASNAISICKGCECASICKTKDLKAANGRCPKSIKTQNVKRLVEIIPISIPEVRYGMDGTIKIKEVFDVDVPIVDSIEVSTKDDNKIDVANVKYVPYNSCKAVLGNCIVSGDGTIGEGCLCAKMAMDEGDSMSAQEIEEITPHPK